MDVWNSLTSIHHARGFGSRLQLCRNFNTASMKGSQSMESWIGGGTQPRKSTQGYRH